MVYSVVEFLNTRYNLRCVLMKLNHEWWCNTVLQHIIKADDKSEKEEDVERVTHTTQQYWMSSSCIRVRIVHRTQRVHVLFSAQQFWARSLLWEQKSDIRLQRLIRTQFSENTTRTSNTSNWRVSDHTLFPVYWDSFSWFYIELLYRDYFFSLSVTLLIVLLTHSTCPAVPKKSTFLTTRGVRFSESDFCCSETEGLRSIWLTALKESSSSKSEHRSLLSHWVPRTL